jgi:hypothetical protein
MEGIQLIVFITRVQVCSYLRIYHTDEYLTLLTVSAGHLCHLNIHLHVKCQ